MTLKKGDIVKLLPSWKGIDGPSSPVWGGPFGYIMGAVDKVLTGSHTPSEHRAVVKWSNATEESLPEAFLETLTPDQTDVGLDAKSACGPLPIDLWILIRTSQGNYGLSVVENMPFGGTPYATPDVRYIANVSRTVLPTVMQNDFNLIGHMLSQPDFEEARFGTVYSAVEHIYRTWELPVELLNVPLPTCEFKSIREAAESAQGLVGPAVCMFHTPNRLMDFTSYPSG